MSHRLIAIPRTPGNSISFRLSIDHGGGFWRPPGKGTVLSEDAGNQKSDPRDLWWIASPHTTGLAMTTALLVNLWGSPEKTKNPETKKSRGFRGKFKSI